MDAASLAADGSLPDARDSMGEDVDVPGRQGITDEGIEHRFDPFSSAGLTIMAANAAQTRAG